MYLLMSRAKHYFFGLEKNSGNFPKFPIIILNHMDEFNPNLSLIEKI